MRQRIPSVGRVIGEDMAQQVLIIEDDSSIAMLMEQVLTDEGFAVARAQSAETARERIDEHQPDLAILDLLLPGVDATEFCRSLRAGGFDAPIIVVSALNHADEVAETIGAPLLRKPFDIDELVAVVREAVGPAG